MGYLEIIGIGYLFNLFAVILILILILVMGIMEVFTKNPIEVMAQNRVYLQTIEEFKLKKITVPSDVYKNLVDYGIYFPFGYIFRTLQFLVFSFKYGPMRYMTYSLRARIIRIDRYTEGLK